MVSWVVPAILLFPCLVGIPMWLSLDYGVHPVITITMLWSGAYTLKSKIETEEPRWLSTLAEVMFCMLLGSILTFCVGCTPSKREAPNRVFYLYRHRCQGSWLTSGVRHE